MNTDHRRRDLHAVAASLHNALQGTEAAELRIDIPRSDTAPVGYMTRLIAKALEGWRGAELPEVTWVGDGRHAEGRRGIPFIRPDGTSDFAPDQGPGTVTAAWRGMVVQMIVDAHAYRDESADAHPVALAEHTWQHLYGEERGELLGTMAMAQPAREAFEWWCSEHGIWPRPEEHGPEEGRRWAAQFVRPGGDG